MCGISVIVELSKPVVTSDSRDALHQQMQASLDRIDHRGPDSRGIWISDDEKVVLGHARLAINDLSPSGFQPLHSSDGSVHAVVNGELYDFEQLKNDLIQQHGCRFSGNSDSEIVVALYQAYGMDFLQYLRGEFAFCIYDEKKKIFIAARDRYGIKPLFWTTSNGRLLIAAEMKAFLPLNWKPQWDVKSLVEAGWNFDDRTVFRDVKKVRPGYYMTCDASGQIEHKQYWDMDYPDKHVLDDRTEEEIVQGVRDRLLEAVRIRLRADVPVGVYLSGGIDSSVIAGLVTHLVKEQSLSMGNLPSTDRVSCFTVAFDATSGFDESDIASNTAAFLGVRLHKQVMDEAAFASRFADATYHCEHHNPDLNFVGKFALSELPRDLGFKVVLTGEGADEIFTGYNIFLPDVLREPDLTFPAAAIPEPTRTHLLARSEAETSAYYTSIGASSPLSTPSPARSKLNDISTPACMSAFIPSIFSPSLYSCLSPLPPESVIANAIPSPIISKIQRTWHPAHAAQYIWSKTHLPNQFMSCLGDRTEMAHSIEGRTPFLDPRLTSYVNCVPPGLKMRFRGLPASSSSSSSSPSLSSSSQRKEQREQEHVGQEQDPTPTLFTAKHALREAARPFITPAIYTRQKHPYSAPLAYPLHGPLHSLLSSLLTREKVEGLGFVDWEEARDLVGRAFGGKEARAMRLVFVVAQWVVLGERFGVERWGEGGEEERGGRGGRDDELN